MSPNSSILLLDISAPIIWLKITDGAGYLTLTPYTITPYTQQTVEDKLGQTVSKLDERISRLFHPLGIITKDRTQIQIPSEHLLKKGVRIWVEWEKTTKTLYQKLCKELFQVGEIASAHFFMKLIKGVDEELEEAQKYHLKLESINYAIEVIINQN